MKIRISIPGTEVYGEYDKEIALQIFGELTHTLLNHQADQTDPEQEPVKMIPRGYKGFLFLKCPVCGAKKAFSPKVSITEGICKECGHKFPLEDLVLMFVNCECGSNFKYRTNMQEDMFDFSCLNCGQPVTESWNAKKGIYETIRRTS